MTGKTHQIVGITAGLGYFLIATDPSYNPATLAAVLVGSSLAALLPDIDQPAAKIWHTIPYGDEVGEVATTFIKHRNISHSLLGTAIVGGILYWLLHRFPVYWGIDANLVWLSMLLAYCFHLLADMFTVEGIPILFPYKKMVGIPPHPFDGIRIETGKWFENLVLFPIFNLTLIIFIISNWQKLKLILFK